ncbi:C3HC zinc finger-like protein [Prunus dulcis]|uniref:C3HC zinc finger-like protein n=1 Tax=Prunus dulcis TaxID=3755 RepID=A0A4Y1RJL8_PRUDU|nr:C3HC zinc finger-like protein [Prunus dulcis]
MSKDSEKRFHSIMDKLFFAPKSAPSPTSGSSSAQTSRGKKRANPSSALALVEPKSRSDRVEAAQHLSVPPAPAHAPLCRPWDRGDLMRRVATFKSMTWFAKPKVVSAINCARRGWINVDTDIIACESCGALEKAALVFSLKLDNGHKILCPWIDNTCDEILAEFPPTPPPVLVDKFRERCSALLQLSVLPVISSSAIQYMKSPQLEQFLGQSSMFYGNGSGDIARTEHSDNEGSADSAKLYYQAQKLISLCGWEPRSLPYVVDSENRLNHSVMKANISSSSHSATNGQNPSINVHSTRNDELVEVERNASTSSSIQSEPNSVVIDCKLCGASVGLWAFSTVPRPLEFFRLVGYAEVHSESHPGTPDSSTKNHLDNRVDTVGAGSDGATLSKERFSNLNLTIAGVLHQQNRTSKQQFLYLARFSYDSEFRDSMSVSQEVMQSDSQMDKGDKHDRENAGNVGLENSEVRDPRTASDANITYENGETDKNDSLVMVSSEGKLLQSGIVVDGSEKQDSPSVPSNLEDNADVNSSITDAQPTSNCEGSENRVLIPINNELVACSSGKDLTHVLPGCTMEFDPIRQHRYFCPWIVSAGNGHLDGNKHYLLYNDRKGVDDPVTSIRNLFTSPPPKRMKPTVLTETLNSS